MPSTTATATMTLEERNRVLARAKARVLAGWCREHGAQDAAGEDMDVLSPEAKSFCVAGALAKESGIEFYGNSSLTFSQVWSQPQFIALYAAAKQLGAYSPAEYNDNKCEGKYAAAALFDHAMLEPMPSPAVDHATSMEPAL